MHNTTPVNFCPYCHSPHTQCVGQQELKPPSQAPALSSFSPMTLATMGMQVSQRLHLPPLFGGLAGLVVGGMILLYLNQHKPQLLLSFYCQQCGQNFTLQHNS